jgi:UDP-GlcNAc3NAcA epimerase
MRVIVPVHPRTQKKLKEAELSCTGLELVQPLSYLDILLLEREARIILTDSGGVQKEAFWFGVPCVTLREETEWVETLESGRNVLTGADSERIVAAAASPSPTAEGPRIHDDGPASEKIVDFFLESMRHHKGPQI